MSFLLITADFPPIQPEQLLEVFSRLECDNWLKMHNHSRYDNTIWFGPLAKNLPLREAITQAKENFYSCCMPYCQPKLLIECEATAADVNENASTNPAVSYCGQTSMTITRYRRPATCEPSMFSIIKESLSERQYQSSGCC